MILLLLAGLALAGPPEPHDPVPGECPEIVAIRPGQPLPASIDPNGDGIPDCGGSLLPASEHLDLLAWRSWADELELRNRLIEARLVELEQPPPLWERPGVARAVGRVEVLVTLAVTAAVIDHYRRP